MRPQAANEDGFRGIQEDLRTNFAGGPRPPDNGNMELAEKVARLEEKVAGIGDRLSLVEKDLRDISRKIDTHFYWVLAAMVGLAGLMAKGFKWF